MVEVAEEKGVPCVNNYAHSLNLLDDHVIEWADEGYITDDTPNLHFSRAANEYISTAFIGELERM